MISNQNHLCKYFKIIKSKLSKLKIFTDLHYTVSHLMSLFVNFQNSNIESFSLLGLRRGVSISHAELNNLSTLSWGILLLHDK